MGEGATCLTEYFKFETSEDGKETGRKRQKMWLIPNTQNTQYCPFRLFKKLIGKRGPQFTCSRLFLTPNPFWQNINSFWYKNSPIGKNEFSI